MERPFTAAVGSCLAACAAVTADALGATWARVSGAGFEGFVRYIARHRLSEALFVTTSFVAVCFGTWALVQIARSGRRRGGVLALLGIAAPWLARGIHDIMLGGG